MNNRLSELLEEMSIHLIDMELLYKERGKGVINQLESDDYLNLKRECIAKEVKLTISKLAIYIPRDFSDFLDYVFLAINNKFLDCKTAHNFISSIGGRGLVKEMVDCQNSWLIYIRKCFHELAFSFLKNEEANECLKILELYGWKEDEGLTSDNEKFNLSWDFLIVLDESKKDRMQKSFDKLSKNKKN